MKYVMLSYPVDESTPLYPGTPEFKMSKVKDILKGDACNTFLINASNHCGTHIDCPSHFFQNGKKVSDHKPSYFIFKNAIVMDIPKKADEPITAEELNRFRGDETTEFVMVRTGFSKYRSTRPSLYSGRNPYLFPETAEALKKRFKKIRAFGIDTISISSALHREIGKAAHKTLLGGKRPILIVEDMNIPLRVRSFDDVIVSPFFAGNVDSSPCAATGVKGD